MKAYVDLNRFQEKINEIKNTSDISNSIVLLGSSIFANENMKNVLNGLEVCNLSIKDFTLHEALNHCLTLIGPIAPKCIILQFGINDIVQGYSLKQIEKITNDLIVKLHKNYPRAKVLLMSCVGSFARQDYTSFVSNYNDWVKSFTRPFYFLDSVDLKEIWWFSGGYNYSNFEHDRDTLNEQGYKALSNKIIQVLERNETMDLSKERFVDANKYRIKSEKKSLVLTSFVFLLFAAAIIFFADTTKMTLSIILAVLIVLFDVAYVVVDIKLVLSHYLKLEKLYKIMSGEEQVKEELVYISQEDNVFYQGARFIKLNFENGKSLYIMREYLPLLTKNAKYIITSKHSVVYKIEKIKIA